MELVDYFSEMWRLALAGKARGIFFYASLYALLLPGLSFIYQWRVAAWPATPGQLLHGEVRKVGGTEWAPANQDYALDALYTYSVDGRQYQGRRISPWVMVASHNARFILQKQLRQISHDSQGRVQVFFNPRNPAKSFLLKPGWFGRGVTLLLAVCPALLYWRSYHD